MMVQQWAAGAPVIGAAPVSSGKPKRPFRMTVIMRLGRSNFLNKRKEKKERKRKQKKKRKPGKDKYDLEQHESSTNNDELTRHTTKPRESRRCMPPVSRRAQPRPIFPGPTTPSHPGPHTQIAARRSLQ